MKGLHAILLAMPDQTEDVVAWTDVPEHAPVVASDGTEIGKVTDVAALEDEDIFHGIVFAPSGLSRKHLLVPAADIDRITTRAVYLSKDSAAAANYQEFEQLHVKRIGLRGIFGWKHFGWKDSAE